MLGFVRLARYVLDVGLSRRSSPKRSIMPATMIGSPPCGSLLKSRYASSDAYSAMRQGSHWIANLVGCAAVLGRHNNGSCKASSEGCGRHGPPARSPRASRVTFPRSEATGREERVSPSWKSTTAALHFRCFPPPSPLKRAQRSRQPSMYRSSPALTFKQGRAAPTSPPVATARCPKFSVSTARCPEFSVSAARCPESR